MVVETVDTKALYEKYIGQITCAYADDIFIDRQGNTRVGAKRVKEREKYLFRGLGRGRDPVLIECPPDVIPIEFDADRSISEEAIVATAENLQRIGLDYCIADHGGRSLYIYLWNVQGIPKGWEQEGKKQVVKRVVPSSYHKFFDYSNLGRGLLPVLGREHWKPKYKGAIHRVVSGKYPLEHRNDIGRFIESQSYPPKRKFKSKLLCNPKKMTALPISFLRALQSHSLLHEHWSTAIPGDCSKHDWILLHLCFEKGIKSIEELAIILMNSPHGKYQQRNVKWEYIERSVRNFILSKCMTNRVPQALF